MSRPMPGPLAAPLSRPTLSTVAELLKPITWFPPMWAFACGVVSSGVSPDGLWSLIVVGVLLAGPLVCATSQAVNDWFDRHVDAINEPARPIPSGRMPGRWGLGIAIAWTGLSLLVATALGPWGFGAAVLGLVLAWLYSAPPVRLKENGWLGNAACGLSYESLAWITGAAVMAGGAMPDPRSIALALLYGLGAHGIMTLNDFKAVEGDLRMGVRSLPVRLGVDRAAVVACWTMAVPQFVVIGLLFAWDRPWHATAVSGLLVAQYLLMRAFVARPVAKALMYSGFGVPLYVAGMMVAAFGLRSLGAH
ncbi:MAG: chlorophyll synthase ChlG [Burkholderiaceae bacterium]|nr:chlorophyll synthase ChlG [Burkholderiales bacterium]MCZ8096647.1 chlorophyll synthase ChlG [Burkholderiales bacterium]MCZ8337684.1 chlorophyll synthase ChlG [Burkholderiaceae bacterium]